MKRIFSLLLSVAILNTAANAQNNTPNDGDWSKQLVILKNTAEADVMIRIGDIDNLGFGWAEGFVPFSGRSTDSHSFPWDIDKNDAAGTDRIFVVSGCKNCGGDGYTANTKRPENKPVPIQIPLAEIKGIPVNSVWLQLFIDDFQAPDFGTKYQVKINGMRFPEAERIINKISQTGPIGKFISLRLTDELLQKINPDSTLIISIDDPKSNIGDGFAIDFVKLLVNPKGIIYKGNVTGTVVDADTRKPIANATVEVKDYGTTTTNADGEFILKELPAGLDIITGSAAGYSSDSKQVDVIDGETTENVQLELKRSGKVVFNNKTLQEGDNLIMNNVQFEVNSANLLPAGKQELDKLVLFMQQNANVEILLSGHTSAEGGAAANRDLSLRRVRSCKNYLTAKGIDDGRITIKGFGPDKPIAPNDTEANRARNRRVEMQVTKL